MATKEGRMNWLESVYISVSRGVPFDPVWDCKLNELLDDHKFTDVDPYCANLGGVRVWIANRPYADFTCRNPQIDYSPSLKTLRRARARLIEDQLEDVKCKTQ